ncbi:MAG: methyl-accepting chemotaxis protein, partial [Stenotrophomonas sp.]
ATAAARSMEEQAGHLTDAVSLFKLDTHAAPVVAVAAIATRTTAPTRARAATPAPARRAPAREPALANESDWQEF